MASEHDKTSDGSVEEGDLLRRPVTRRDFLKVGAVAGAALGVGGARGRLRPDPHPQRSCGMSKEMPKWEK
jgi:hypothetical protein